MAKEYDREWHWNEAVLADFSPYNSIRLQGVSKMIEAPIALLEIERSHLDHKFRWTVTIVTETHVTESLLSYVCRLLKMWGCTLSSRGVRKIAISDY
jgi:hypothetical protein